MPFPLLAALLFPNRARRASEGAASQRSQRGRYSTSKTQRPNIFFQGLVPDFVAINLWRSGPDWPARVAPILAAADTVLPV